MVHTTTILAALVTSAGALVAQAGNSAQSCGSGLVVTTTSGELHGFINSSAPWTRQFLGVPYAEPPLDSLRFKPPRRKRSSAIVDARKYQPSCKQQTSNATTIYTEYMQEFLINGGDSEDCLYLNVYAPLYPVEEKLPVLLYIPGGGFTGGGADSLFKIPDKWINKTQSHIVITMNYRLNIFGYPSARGASLNVGLLDQRLVVEWAYDNIAQFGGDPERMTLWGQSAGAMSASYYAYGWYYDPIVKGLIADSGAASSLKSPNTQQFTTLAGKVGCGDLDSEEELACMQKVDANDLAKLVSTTANVRFSPVADNVTMYGDIQVRAAQGFVAQIPMISGNNDNEGAGFSPASGQTQATWEGGLSAISCPVSKEVALRTQNNFTTYRYYYAGNFTNVSPKPWIGASHSAELPLLFGTHYEYRGNSTDFEWEVSDVMQGLWLSFAANSSQDPSYGSLTWPKYSTSANTMAYFAADDKVLQFVNGSLADGLCPKSTCPTCANFGGTESN